MKPASINELDEYIYPKCGDDNVKNVNILSWYLIKWGNAARIITPPNEWPINESLPSELLGHHSVIKFITSFERFKPNSIISPSVSYSFA